MFLSKKSRNFIYTILYLLPIIFVLLSLYFSKFSFLSDFTQNNISTYLSQYGYAINNSIETFLTSYFLDYEDYTLFPICSLFNFLFDGYMFDNYQFDFMFMVPLYLDYCIWVSVGIIAFEVITILPVICRKFFNKLGGF